MPLHDFLTRLIWLCMLPLVLLAAYLGYDRVRALRSENDVEAAHLAKNFATAIDQNLNARIGALHILAMSPHMDQPADWRELYREAQSFYESFGSHVILADRDMRMVFNTRAPLGTRLPAMPRPAGRAAAPAALESGKPAVGDIFLGPLAAEPLIAIAVPALRNGRTDFLILTIFETRVFQNRLEQIALPADWSLSLLDGTGAVIARGTPPGFDSASDPGAAERVVVKSEASAWSVVLEIPRNVYRRPLVGAAAELVITILGATLVGVLGGQLASRRLGKAVASLATAPVPGASPPAIAELAAVRRLLDESAAALQDLNAGLEKRIEARTADLTAALKEIESFAYSVSHDLRTPLRSIDGFAKMLEEDYAPRLDDEGVDALHRVRGAAQRMGELIDDLLKLSHLTRADMRRETVDLSALARAVAGRLQERDPARTVAFDIAPRLEVRGDGRLLTALLENLLGNAWKFTGRHASARIEVGVMEQDGRRCYFVRDDGAGFDMAHATNLFAPFQRLHNSSEFPGTGIGLATVQRIVQRHGGRVWAEGAVERGATFYFTLAD